jgi:hypothetical protein
MFPSWASFPSPNGVRTSRKKESVDRLRAATRNSHPGGNCQASSLAHLGVDRARGTEAPNPLGCTACLVSMQGPFLVLSWRQRRLSAVKRRLFAAFGEVHPLLKLWRAVELDLVARVDTEGIALFKKTAFPRPPFEKTIFRNAIFRKKPGIVQEPIKFESN